MNDQAEYELLGEFAVHEAKRVTSELDQAGVEYEVEIDESGIKGMTPLMIVTHGGTAGLGCTLRLFVQPHRVKEARAILDLLFPV